MPSDQDGCSNGNTDKRNEGHHIEVDCHRGRPQGDVTNAADPQHHDGESPGFGQVHKAGRKPKEEQFSGHLRIHSKASQNLIGRFVLWFEQQDAIADRFGPERNDAADRSTGNAESWNRTNPKDQNHIEKKIQHARCE